MSEKGSEKSRKTAEAVKRTAETTANGIYQIVSYITRHDARVADAAQAMTQIVGAGLDKAGRNLANASKHAGNVLHSNASRLADKARKSAIGNETSSA